MRFIRTTNDPSRDKIKTIAQLKEVGAACSQDKRGVIGDTLNRRLTLLGQIFRHAAARGASALEKIDLSKLRAAGTKGRARDTRAKLPIEKFKGVFRAPPAQKFKLYRRIAFAHSRAGTHRWSMNGDQNAVT
jgi:hypothetical protein